MSAAVLLIKVPRLTVADVVVKYERLILGEDTYCINT